MGNLNSMIVDGLAGAAVACILGIFVCAAKSSLPSTVEEVADTFRFRYGGVLRAFAWFMMFGVPILITLAFAFANREEGDWIYILLLYAMGAFFGVPIWWEMTQYSLTVSSAGLELASPWRRRTEIAWEDVDQVAYNLGCKWFVLRSTEGRVIRVPLYVNGISDFLSLCERYLTATQLAGAKPGYAELRLPFYGETS
jgi:hypothetical protein